MTRIHKILGKILRGTADANVPFEDLCHLVRGLGFEERVIEQWIQVATELNRPIPKPRGRLKYA
jgi:hypothetical protein